jgi:hypothetical protein
MFLHHPDFRGAILAAWPNGHAITLQPEAMLLVGT